MTPARKTKFLAELARTGSFTASAKRVDGSEGTRRSYKVLQAKDPAFARDCEEALHQYSEAVHQVIREQFFEGSISPVVSGGHIVKDKNGNEVWLKTKDSRILLNYLKRWKPEYTDAKNLNINVDGQQSDPSDPELRIRASELWQLPAHESAQLLALLRKIHANRNETLVDITPPPILEGEAVEEIPAETQAEETARMIEANDL